jgi:hypothetical protein
MLDKNNKGSLDQADVLAFLTSLTKALKQSKANIWDQFDPKQAARLLFGSLKKDVITSSSSTQEARQQRSNKKDTQWLSLISLEGAMKTTAETIIGSSMPFEAYSERASFHEDILLCFNLLFHYFQKNVVELIEDRSCLKTELNMKLKKLRENKIKKPTALIKDYSEVRCVVKGGFYALFWSSVLYYFHQIEFVNMWFHFFFKFR